MALWAASSFSSRMRILNALMRLVAFRMASRLRACARRSAALSARSATFSARSRDPGEPRELREPGVSDGAGEPSIRHGTRASPLVMTK
jgi:hypothetical protein